MQRVITMLISLLALSTAAHAEVYHWADKHGKKHFSDTPPKDQEAQTMELQPPPNIGQGEREKEIAEHLEQLRERVHTQDMTPEELEEYNKRKDEERQKKLPTMK